jgi:hypothetical protein
MIKTRLICAVVVTLSAVGLALADAPFIQAIDPDYGMPGDIVVLTGEFIPSEKENAVTFAGLTARGEEERIQAEIVWLRGESKLAVKVPTAAKSGPVTVTLASGKTSNGVNFTVKPGPPYITGIKPDHGVPGDQVEIHGFNFESAAKDNIVHFTATGKLVKAKTITSTTGPRISTLLVEVPPGTIDGQVTVAVGGNSSNPVQFTIDKMVPKAYPPFPKQLYYVDTGGWRSSLVLDSGNIPHIGYVGTYSQVKYATWDDAQQLWVPHFVPAEPPQNDKAVINSMVSVAFSESAKMPRICYNYQGGKGPLRYAGYYGSARVGNKWDVADIGGICRENALVLTKKDEPRVAYCGWFWQDFKGESSAGNQLGYAEYDPAAAKWKSANIVKPPLAGSAFQYKFTGCALALDSKEAPHVVSLQVSWNPVSMPVPQKVRTGAVKYWNRPLATWLPETVEEYTLKPKTIKDLVEGLVHPSVVLDSAEDPIVSYSIHSEAPPYLTGELRLARRLGPNNWDVTTLVKERITWSSSLAYDPATETLIICYYERDLLAKPDEPAIMLKYMPWDVKAWKLKQPPTVVDSWTFNQLKGPLNSKLETAYTSAASIALETGGRVRITYCHLSSSSLHFYAQP